MVDPRALQQFEQGFAYENAGMLEEAAAYYRQALALAPNFTEAYCNLGVVLGRLGKLEEAADHYRRAIELRPELVQAWFNLGKVLQDLGRSSESASAYGEALRLNPHHAHAHNNLGVVLTELGQTEEAVRHFEAAVSIAPTWPDFLGNLALMKVKQGRGEEAIGYYDRMLQIAPEEPLAHKPRAILRETMAAPAILSQGRTPEQLRQVVDDALLFADQTLQYFAKPGGLACKKGCSWCCNLQVSVSAAEILRIADYVREHFSEEQLLTLRTRLADVVSKTRGMDAQERAISGVPCALLIDNACSVYAVRPLICRGWNSRDVGPCEEATKRAGINIHCYATQRAIYDGTAGGLIAGLAQAGYPAELYDLCSGLLIALEQPNAVERWLAGEPIFSSALRRQSFQDQLDRVSLL